MKLLGSSLDDRVDKEEVLLEAEALEVGRDEEAAEAELGQMKYRV